MSEIVIRIQLPEGSTVVTESNPPSPEYQPAADGPGFQQGGESPADPWVAQGAPSGQSAPAQSGYQNAGGNNAPSQSQATSTAPTCVHGEMRFVPAGYSKSTNKPYKAFYGCPAPRGTQQCRSVPA